MEVKAIDMLKTKKMNVYLILCQRRIYRQKKLYNRIKSYLYAATQGWGGGEGGRLPTRKTQPANVKLLIGGPISSNISPFILSEYCLPINR